MHLHNGVSCIFRRFSFCPARGGAIFPVLFLQKHAVGTLYFVPKMWYTDFDILNFSVGETSFWEARTA